MKKEMLTFLIFGLSVATIPAAAQQQRAQTNRRPTATQTAPAVSATPTAPTAPTTPTAPAPSAPSAPNAAAVPGVPAPPSGFPGGGRNGFALMRLQMEATTAARGQDGKIDVEKFKIELFKAAKAADSDSNGVLSNDELTALRGAGRGQGAFGAGVPNAPNAARPDAASPDVARPNAASPSTRPSRTGADTRGTRDANAQNPSVPNGGFPGAPAPTGITAAVLEATNEDGSISLTKLEETVSKALKTADADADAFLNDAESAAFFGFGGGPGGFPGGMQSRGRGMGLMLFQRQALTAATTEDGKVDVAKFRSEYMNLLKAGDENSDGILDDAEIEKLQEKARESMGGGMGGPGMGGGFGRPGQGGFGGGDPFAAMKNADGKIELAKLSENIPEAFATLLKEADADGDGLLDAQELETMQTKMREQFQRGPGMGAPGQNDGGRRGASRGSNDAAANDLNDSERIVRAQQQDAAPQAIAPQSGGFPGQGGPGMGGSQRGGFPGMGGFSGMGGFPGQGGPGMRRSSSAVQKALTKATQEDGKVDLAKLDAELAKLLADSDNEDDGLLDETEQRDAFGQTVAPRVPSDENGRPSRSDASDADQRGVRGDRPEAGNAGPSARPSSRGDNNSVQTRGIPTPDDSFVAVSRNENFRFGKSATGAGVGEKLAIDYDYAIGVYEVRNREYKEFVDATGRTELPKYWVDGTFAPGTKNCPVVGVTLKDAQDYCEWLGTRFEGWTFRLPTEAEFENAAAGPKKLRYPWGTTAGFAFTKGALTTCCQYNGAVVADLIAQNASAQIGEKTVKVADVAAPSAKGVVDPTAWRDTKTKTGFTYSDLFMAQVKIGGYVVPVNRFAENESPFGCVGMAGNAAEWTTSVVDGKNVVRGGSWYSTADECATTYRGDTKDPMKADPTVGFRVVAEPTR